jgi:hypothetical protein
MARPRSWTDDDLRDAVGIARNISEVTRLLGLTPSGWSNMLARTRIAELGLDASHFRPGAPSGRPPPLPPRPKPRTGGRKPSRSNRRWTDEQLAAAVSEVRSVAAVLRRLGLKPGGGVYVAINQRIAELGLDTSHFKGQGWAKGLKNPVRRPVRPLAEILVRDSDYLHTDDLRKRLLREGLKAQKCEACGGTSWNDRPIPLQLDHINGIRTDNRLVNLRLLCPNCHAQTETYCGKNVGRRKL